MDFKKALAHKKTLIPKDGFNVVGIDKMAMPDEALYFISHHKDEGEAKASVNEQEKDGVTAYIYDQDTH